MTVVLDKSATLAGTDDGDANTNLNFRQEFDAAVLGAATGTQLRVTLLFGTAEPTESPALDDMWVGQKGAGTYDFTGNQVQLKFGGSNSINGSAAGVVTSDFVTLGETWDNTKAYVFAFHVNSAANCNISLAAVTNCSQGYNGTPGASTSSQTSPSIPISNPTNLGLIEKIEIQAAGGGGSPAKTTILMMGV